MWNDSQPNNNNNNNKIDYSIIESKIKFKESLVIKIKTSSNLSNIKGWAGDVNSQDRDETETSGLETETRCQPSRPRRDRDVCFDCRDETSIRPRRDRDERLHNSRPLQGVTKVISCSHQGWSTMAKDLHFQHDFIKINQHQKNSCLFK